MELGVDLQVAGLEPVAEHPWALLMAWQSWPGREQAGLHARESRACARGFMRAPGLLSSAAPLSASTFSPCTVPWCPEISCKPTVLLVPLVIFAGAPHEHVPVLGTPGAGRQSLPDLNGV